VAVRPSDDVVSVWRAFLRYHRAAVQRLDAELLAAHGATLEEYDVLVQLAEAPEGRLRMGQLAAATLIAPSSCTRVVDRLVARRWVERVRDPADRRRVVVDLTAAGRGGLRRCAVTHLAGIAEVFGERLTRADLAALGRALDHLTDGPSA
jgi:DNA-binding MarR family transcriptional regulator